MLFRLIGLLKRENQDWLIGDVLTQTTVIEGRAVNSHLGTPAPWVHHPFPAEVGALTILHSLTNRAGQIAMEMLTYGPDCQPCRQCTMVVVNL